MVRGSGLELRLCCSHSPATLYGYKDAEDGPKNKSQGKAFAKRLADGVPAIFADLYEQHANRFYEQTIDARAAATRYLKHIAATADLNETLQRMRANADEEHSRLAKKFMTTEGNTLSHGRDLWEIALLCHVKLWERSPEACLGVVNYKDEQSDAIEAQRRINIVVSRLARCPGWPLHDPLVPNRQIDEEERPWRDGKPSMVAELIDDHLEAGDKRCECGRLFSYQSHDVDTSTSSPTAQITIRCNAGHEDTMEMAGNLPG